MSQTPFVRSEIPPGTLIDNRYVIQRLLGQGGLGRTYLAEDTRRFNEYCVLKEFAPNGTGGQGLEKSRNLFKREAKILHQVQHPQIPKFLACFEGEGRLFLVQEFVDGKTYSTLLRERQSRGQTFSEPEVIVWLKRLLPVLEYIHSRGIIHRDISPDNIMLPSETQLPVLIDFGVGKQIADLNEAEGQQGFVGKMSLVGKVGYAPREQISLGRCFPSSDLYALGVTAVVLLTGKDPSHLMDQYSLEWDWRGFTQVSNRFAEILDKMLVDTPRARYQSVAEVMGDLNQLEPFVHDSELRSTDLSTTSRGYYETTASLPENWAASHESAWNHHGVSNFPPEQGSCETIASLPEEKPLRPAPEPVVQSPRPINVSPWGNQASQPRNDRTNSLPPGFIERCQRELALCIGPIAGFVIEEVLERNAAASIYQLVEALELEIPNPQDAIAFRRRLLS